MPIPLLFGFAFIGLGTAISGWYVLLSDKDKNSVDKFCWAWARKTFGLTSPNQMTDSQKSQAAKAAYANRKRVTASSEDGKPIDAEVIPPKRRKAAKKPRPAPEP